MRSREISWTLVAASDLKSIHPSIAQSNPLADDRKVAIVVTAILGLVDFAERGRPGRRPATRKLVIAGTPYSVAHRIRASQLILLAVMHSARR
jgi:plasmid stabilization system protein ParE